jgi:poly(A) polymerase
MRYRYTTGKGGKPVKAAIVYTQKEHGINKKAVDKDAIFIIERLRLNGCEAYIVGGAVRDLILGERPKDFDVVTSAQPPVIKKIFRSARVIGRRFRLVHVHFGDKIIEVSTFRSLAEGTTSNVFGTIEEDVLRRDFSLNALFYDPLEELVIDYVGGMEDIRAKRIRPVIDLASIFVDDPVRMVRALKYAATTGFSLPFKLRRRIRKDAHLLEPVSPSRLTEEMVKIIKNCHTGAIIRNLQDFGLYHYMQAGAAGRMAKDPAFKEHYLASMDELAKKNSAEKPLPMAEQLAALVRDYLNEEFDWNDDKSSSWEGFTEAFSLARSFVLPMNPVRVELERAVRAIFKEHGHTVRRIIPRRVYQ